MKRKGTIVQYSLEEIKKMNRELGSGIDWDRVNAMTDEEIERNALEDNRLHGIPNDWYKTATRVDGSDGESRDDG